MIKDLKPGDTIYRVYSYNSIRAYTNIQSCKVIKVKTKDYVTTIYVKVDSPFKETGLKAVGYYRSPFAVAEDYLYCMFENTFKTLGKMEEDAQAYKNLLISAKTLVAFGKSLIKE